MPCLRRDPVTSGFRVKEWTINIETAPGSISDDQAERMRANLVSTASPAGPAITVDLDNGLVRAVYQVTGKDYPAAASRAIAVFFQAQVSAGVEPTMRTLRITTAAI